MVGHRGQSNTDKGGFCRSTLPGFLDDLDGVILMLTIRNHRGWKICVMKVQTPRTSNKNDKDNGDKNPVTTIFL